jgi:hypothetical protein
MILIKEIIFILSTLILVNANAICEGQTLSISCSDGKVIEIKQAFYGRKDRTTCAGFSIPLTTSCEAKDAQDKLEDLCNGEDSCKIKVDGNAFGDPCPLTSKYLNVEYECKEMSQSERSKKNRRLIACEHKVLSISCPPNQRISISDAFYGRKDRSTCFANNVQTPILTTKCEAKESENKVKYFCDKKNSCQITAGNGVFGDPCYGTFKYLQVDYKCKGKDSSEEDDDDDDDCEEQDKDRAWEITICTGVGSSMDIRTNPKIYLKILSLENLSFTVSIDAFVPRVVPRFQAGTCSTVTAVINAKRFKSFVIGQVSTGRPNDWRFRSIKFKSLHDNKEYNAECNNCLIRGPSDEKFFPFI